jgi:hypothetical protein
MQHLCRLHTYTCSRLSSIHHRIMPIHRRHLILFSLSYPQLLPHGRSDHLREVHLIRGPPSTGVAAGAAQPVAAAVQPTLAVPLMALPVPVVPLLQLVGRVLVLPAGVDRVPGGGPPVRRRRRSKRPRFPTPYIQYKKYSPVRDG